MRSIHYVIWRNYLIERERYIIEYDTKNEHLDLIHISDETLTFKRIKMQPLFVSNFQSMSIHVSEMLSTFMT